MSEVLVEITRGPLVETLHRGDVAVVDTAGRLLYAAGDPRRKEAFWRSSAKPFQAMPIVYTGAADAFGFSPEDLALFCASHNGEPVHTERALAVLQRIGLGPEFLRCGAHLPYDAATARALQQAGQAPGPLHSNCSGKHSGMLSLAVHLGASPEGYLDPGHPVQREILANVARMAGLAPGAIHLGVDGCGVPCFGLSVYHMALAFARLADPQELEPPYRAAAERVREAMLAHPYLVAGRGRICTDLMRQGAGGIVAKSGASGVYCVGLKPELVQRLPAFAGLRGGVGLAVKLEDGGGLGSREVAVVEALRQVGALGPEQLAALRAYARPEVKNVAGRTVGEGRPAFTLRRG